jgi:hypothetical protein
MNTKQKLSVVLVLLCSVMSFGQENWNRISIETGYGYVTPSKLYGSEFSKSDFSGFNHFDIGVRYMFEPNFGVKLNYGRDAFSKGEAGVTFNTIIASAVYNVGSLFDLKRATNEKIGLLGRVGVGVTFAKPETISGTEHIGTATIGLTPQVKVSEGISFYGDFAYAFRLKQHYGFDGVLLDKEYKTKLGKTAVFSLGLIFYIGDNTKHADWY